MAAMIVYHVTGPDAAAAIDREGFSTREIADVVGVGQQTVVRDLHADSNDSEPTQAGEKNTAFDGESDSLESAPWDAPPAEKSAAAKEREQAVPPNSTEEKTKPN